LDLAGGSASAPPSGGGSASAGVDVTSRARKPDVATDPLAVAASTVEVLATAASPTNATQEQIDALNLLITKGKQSADEGIQQINALLAQL
jgi:hypothetical protein